MHGPEEARGFGLVDEVAAPEELIDRAVAVAQRLGSLHSATFSLTKLQLRAPTLERIRAAHNTQIQQLVEEIWATPEAIQRIREHVERTFGAKKK